MLNLRIMICAATMVLFAHTQASTVALVLKNGVNGYTGCRDNALFEELPGNSSGSFTAFFAGNTQFNNKRRTLIGFDIPTTLTASLITSVTLRIYTDFGRAGFMSATVHPMPINWTEGGVVQGGGGIGQGAPANPGDSTWSHRSFNTIAWTTPGGNYTGASATSGAGIVPENIGFTTITGAGMKTDVQNWINNPAANFGWLLRGDEAVIWNAKRFISSEGAQAFRPELIIEYEIFTSASDWQLY